MDFIHVKCGGKVDTKTRTCTKCKKKWSLLKFYTTTSEIRVIPPSRTKKPLKRGKTSYAKWADKTPKAAQFASRLPNWPRWARILTTLVVGSSLVFLLVWVSKIVVNWITG